MITQQVVDHLFLYNDTGLGTLGLIDSAKLF
jgi:hypothetical protein